jgi:hypothetical protein
VLLLVPFEEINRAAESIVIATLFHTAINIPPPDLERKVLFATTTLLAIAVIVIRRVDGTTAVRVNAPDDGAAGVAQATAPTSCFARMAVFGGGACHSGTIRRSQ